MVVSACREIAGRLVPESGIELGKLGFLRILLLDGLLRDGVDKSRPGNADGAFQAESQLVALRPGGLIGSGGGVESALRNHQFRINERILLSIRKGHRKPALHRRHGNPVDGDLVLVDGREEGRLSHGLRHAGHFGHIGAVVGIVGVLMVDDQQIAITECLGTIGLIRILPLSVTISGMAVQTGFPNRRRSAALERSLIDSDIPFEERLTLVESGFESHSFHGGGGVFVGTGSDVVRRSQFTSRIPLGGCEVSDRLSDVFRVGFLDVRDRKWQKLFHGTVSDYCLTIHSAALFSSSSRADTASMAVCTELSA